MVKFTVVFKCQLSINERNCVIHIRERTLGAEDVQRIAKARNITIEEALKSSTQVVSGLKEYAVVLEVPYQQAFNMSCFRHKSVEVVDASPMSLNEFVEDEIAVADNGEICIRYTINKDALYRAWCNGEFYDGSPL